MDLRSTLDFALVHIEVEINYWSDLVLWHKQLHFVLFADDDVALEH